MKRKFSHTQVIALGFAILILCGTGLLMLPFSSRSGESAPFLTALFTATSASCVTGLAVVDTYTQWSTFGQWVLLVLIQIGGLGFMTIATGFALLLHRRISQRDREVLGESISALQTGGIVRLARFIIGTTFMLEALGAVLLSLRFVPMFGWEGLRMAVFTSVSAFCNAGFDLMGKIMPYSSLAHFQSDPLVILTVSALILAGGLGFLVWDDIRRHRHHLRRYRLHSKIVLTVSVFLLLIPTVAFYFLERNATGAGLSVGVQWLNAFFDAVTPRTAGFNAVDTAALTPASKLLTMMLMFIGGCPGSTAGGIKVTTFMILMLYAFSYARPSGKTSFFGRQVEDTSLAKAASVFFTNLMLAILAALILSALQEIQLTDVLFETFSAIGTVGMTTGITRDLNTPSRVILIVLMYCGRVGSLSFAAALSARRAPSFVKEPTEPVIIG